MPTEAEGRLSHQFCRLLLSCLLPCMPAARFKEDVSGQVEIYAADFVFGDAAVAGVRACGNQVDSPGGAAALAATAAALCLQSATTPAASPVQLHAEMTGFTRRRSCRQPAASPAGCSRVQRPR